MDNRPVNQHFSQSSAAAVLPHQQASRYQSLLSLFPFYPSPFLIDRAIFCFSVISSFSILQDISFFPSLLLTFAISSYITKLHTSFSFSLLPTISSHILASKSLYYSFAHHFYSSTSTICHIIIRMYLLSLH